MDLVTLKNITYLVIAIGTVLISGVGMFFHFKHKMESLKIGLLKVEERFEKRMNAVEERSEKRMDALEKKSEKREETHTNWNKSINRKLLVIEKNLVMLLEKQKLEPVRDLFGEEDGI